MKRGILVSLLASLVQANDIAAVYKSTHCAIDSQEVKMLQVDEAIYNLADDFNLGSQYTIGENVDLKNIAWGKCAGTSEDMNEIVIIINGVKDPQSLFKEQDALFNIELANSSEMNKFKTFVQSIGTGLGARRLSDEISIVTMSYIKQLETIWKQYFFDSETSKMYKMWNDLKVSLSGDSVLNIAPRSINHISDESFINEMAQLDYFFKQNIDGKVIIKLDSLLTMFKKTGGSETYETCIKVLSHLIGEQFQSGLDFTVIALPITTNGSVKTKRSPVSSVDPSASLFSSSKNGCFTSKELCLDSTDSCSSHGSCSNVSGCWSCVCSSTVDDKQTTYWTGSSCEKVDYSSQFHLLFWTSLMIVLAVVSGVKLMYNAGEESMPGVLVAATVQTKKTN